MKTKPETRRSRRADLMRSRHRYNLSRADRNRVVRGEWNRCFKGRPFYPPVPSRTTWTSIPPTEIEMRWVYVPLPLTSVATEPAP